MKPRNRQDATVLNVRAANKRMEALKARIAKLEAAHGETAYLVKLFQKYLGDALKRIAQLERKTK